MRADSGQRLVQVFHGLDEMGLADDDVHLGWLVDGHHFKGHRVCFHEVVIPGGVVRAPGGILTTGQPPQRGAAYLLVTEVPGSW